ncbi:ATP-dependent DNA helicase Q-like SIM isoform X2 [Malania oleifera]|nr:ATP-dependent DNA helicase Q-like SIM isoform X2 [Malania oleifera]
MAKLVEMGFEYPSVEEAIEAVGPSVDDAIEFILNDSRRNNKGVSSSSQCSISNGNALGKIASSLSHSSGQMRQSSITEHLKFMSRPKRSRTNASSDVSGSESLVLPKPVEEHEELLSSMGCNMQAVPESQPVYYQQELEIGSDWEQKANDILRKHFGYSSLKSFQKEALAAWVARQDCLVLAATGSGKSLCFQIPALLTGKVVVVISPLISLMHDQCLKLAKHGVSACFLGSGQPDSRVEKKAMSGMYDIIYVCPETILRLIKPLQRLAETRGIALFAIDEVHCVSKWGHDFRPDYRRLSALRENFSACSLNFLKYDIPLMALTATATIRVREDILQSLCMSKDIKIVLTSFFRPNLRFYVKHSRTSSPSSYEKDFHGLVDEYTKKRMNGLKKHYVSKDSDSASDDSSSSANDSMNDIDNVEDGYFDENDDEVNSADEKSSTFSKGRQLSVKYLEDEADVIQTVDDWDVGCGEFFGQSPAEDWGLCESSEALVPPTKLEERLRLFHEPLEHGPTIIYVPTRKETLSIAKHLCRLGVRAAAYNAKLPKSHLRRVHKEFHENDLEVVVATIAFGMGIDKLNVRRIIHYGWPQSLEAYYQEAGRAGRDGKLADCILYANLSRIPTLLPSQRSQEQTKQAYKMLSDCFRYGMNTSHCRAKMLVEYFGEDFSYEKCLLCDVCGDGPPVMQNLKEEADIFMQTIAAYYGRCSYVDDSFDDLTCDIKRGRFMEKPNIRMLVSRIREQSQKFMATDMLWWRGLARILEDKGYIREGDGKTCVQTKFPEPTKLGLEFLQSNAHLTFNIYPEADMLLSMRNPKSFSTFSEWGKGWADPEIRRQRLAMRQSRRKPRKRKSKKGRPDMKTVRGRLSAKLLKQKQ